MWISENYYQASPSQILSILHMEIKYIEDKPNYIPKVLTDVSRKTDSVYELVHGFKLYLKLD